MADVLPSTVVIITAVESEISARAVVSSISTSSSNALLVPEPSSLEMTVILFFVSFPQPARLKAETKITVNKVNAFFTMFHPFF